MDDESPEMEDITNEMREVLREWRIDEIAMPLGRSGLVVPEAALQAVDDQPVVFVALAGNRFARRDVRPGLRQGGVVEIAEGLQPGEQVATEGSFRLKALLLHERVAAED